MSSWWCIAFFAIGEIEKIDELAEAVPSVFHQVARWDRVGGGLIAEIYQNYDGEAAIEEAIASFPDLAFAGTLIHEQAHPGDIFWIFTGNDGATDWRELRLPENDGRPMTQDEIAKEIAHIDAKRERLTKHREMLLHQPASPDADIPEKNGSPGDQIGQVACIVRKIRRKRLDVTATANVSEVAPEK